MARFHFSLSVFSSFRLHNSAFLRSRWREDFQKNFVRVLLQAHQQVCSESRWQGSFPGMALWNQWCSSLLTRGLSFLCLPNVDFEILRKTFFQVGGHFEGQFLDQKLCRDAAVLVSDLAQFLSFTE